MAKHFRFPAPGSMADQEGHCCVGCGVAMPLEDGHDNCVLCLGHEHALVSKENPQSCMDCFILPARTREARCCFFSAKRTGSHVSEGPRQKIGRMATASEGRREHPGAWQAPLPPLQPMVVRPALSSFPPPASGSGREEEEAEEDVDVETVFSSDDNDLSCAQHTVGEVTRGELAHRVEEVINRASRVLGVALPENPGTTPSRFEEGMEVCPASTQVPLLPDFKKLLCQQFQSPAATHKWSAACRRYSNVQDRDQIACGLLPAVDRTLTPLVSPSSSILGNATCSSKNCRVMASLLAKLHKAMAVQTRLANTGAILSLYLRDLSHQVQADTSVGEELRLASSCLSSVMKEQAEAAGCALASFWVVRRHLWLSQSQLQQGDRDCLLKVPVEPTAMFGPHATALIQQAQESRRCAKEVSGGLARRATGPGRPRLPRPQPAPETSTWGQGDLRLQLEASRQRRYRRQGRGRGPPAKASSRHPPPS